MAGYKIAIKPAAVREIDAISDKKKLLRIITEVQSLVTSQARMDAGSLLERRTLMEYVMVNITSFIRLMILRVWLMS